MATVRRFEDLQVWKESRSLVKLVYQLTAKFPKSETYGLANQMQRAAVSVLSNIAEGFELGSNTEFIQFLYIARGSCGELRSQTYIALDLGYGEQPFITEIQNRCIKISIMLNKFIEYLKSSNIKGHKFHEERAAYATIGLKTMKH